MSENTITEAEKAHWRQCQIAVIQAHLSMPETHKAITDGKFTIANLVEGCADWADFMLAEAKKRGCV